MLFVDIYEYLELPTRIFLQRIVKNDHETLDTKSKTLQAQNIVRVHSYSLTPEEHFLKKSSGSDAI